MKKAFLLLITSLLPASNALAVGNGKTIIQYFVDNALIRLLVSGGYYTLGAMVVLIIICSIYKEARHIVLSVTLAILGGLLVLFAFQSLNNITLIPS